MNSDQDIEAILNDPSTSHWLRDALKTAMLRDPVDVANDAETLAIIFAKRATEQTAQAKQRAAG